MLATHIHLDANANACFPMLLRVTIVFASSSPVYLGILRADELAWCVLITHHEVGRLRTCVLAMRCGSQTTSDTDTARTCQLSLLGKKTVFTASSVSSPQGKCLGGDCARFT